MTEEQIKQNALKAEKEHGNFNYQYQGEAFNKGYIAGAHSRDEEVTRLLAEIEDDNYVISKLRNPWISVDKKLPRKLQNKDYSKEVLCRTEGGTFLVSIYNHKKREWIDGMFIKIAHWMPIP